MSTLTLEVPMRATAETAEVDAKMSTVTLEIPDSVAERLRDAPAQKADAARAAALAALIESLEEVAPEEIIAGERRPRNYATFEEFVDESRAYWKAKGRDFDAALAAANPVMEG